MMPTTLKNWWESLLDRERRLLVICGVVLGIFIIYSVIWSPLFNSVEDLKIQIGAQQKVLHYLQRASTTISGLKAEGIQATQSGGDLLSLAEQTLSQQALSTYLKQVKQPQQNQITLIFQNVPFDKLMQWVQMMVTQHAVSVKQMTATRLSEVGAADVTINLVDSH